MTLSERLTSIAVGLAAIAGVVLAGRYLLDPLFRILARARAREVMTAAALLVVLGAALAMQMGGLSAAIGGVLAAALSVGLIDATSTAILTTLCGPRRCRRTAWNAPKDCMATSC